MYNRNSLVFQKAVSEGQITPQMISDLEQAGILYDGPGPTVERSLEDKLAGLEYPCKEDDIVFTDIHGRDIWNQYRQQDSNNQVINQMTPGQRAQVMMGARAAAFNAQQETSQHYNQVSNFYNNPYGYNPMGNGYTFGNFNNIPKNDNLISVPDTMHISYDEVYGNLNPYNIYRNRYYNNNGFGDGINILDNDTVVSCGNGYYLFEPLTVQKDNEIEPFSKEMDDTCNRIVEESVTNRSIEMINPFGCNMNNQIPAFNNFTQFGNPYNRNPNSIFNGYQYQAGFVSNYQREQEKMFNDQFNIVKQLCKSVAKYNNIECVNDDYIKNVMRPGYSNNQQGNKPIEQSSEIIHAYIGVYDDEGNIVEEIDPQPKNSYVYNNETIQQNFNRMANIYYNSYPYNIFLNNFIMEWNRKFDETRKKFPDSMGVLEFFEKSGTLYNDMLMREAYRKYGHYSLRSINKDKFNKSIEKDRNIYDQGKKDEDKLDFHLRDMSFPGVFKDDNEYTKYTGISYDHSTGTLNINTPDHIRANHPEMIEQPSFQDNIARRIKVQSESLYADRLKAFKDIIESEKSTATSERRGD